MNLLQGAVKIADQEVVYAMINADDSDPMAELTIDWRERGPETKPNSVPQ